MERSFRRAGRGFIPAGLFPALLIFLLWAYTRHNDFPYFYHTDEPGKVDQVISETRNYRHPLLMISATDLAVRLFGIEKTPQNVVRVGRWCSAFAAVLAIAAVVLLVRRQSGWTLSLLAGCIAGLHPFLFEAAHYMKEDCWLLAGLAWTWYALDRFCELASNRSLILAGVASGIATSGKYIGIVALLFAMTLLILKMRSAGWRRVLWKSILLCSVFILVFLAINFQVVAHPAEDVGGAGIEIARTNRERPSVFAMKNFPGRLIAHSGPLLVTAALVYLVTFFKARRQRKIIEWALLGFALGYLLILSPARIERDRYLLPVSTLLAVFAVNGVRSIASWLGDKRPGFPQFAGTVFGCVAILASELPAAATQESEFGSDMRMEMVDWIRKNLPADAAIASHPRSLPNWRRQDWPTLLPQRLLSWPAISSHLGSIGELKRQGVTHVVVAGPGYRGLVGDADVPRKEREEFYSELEKGGSALWRKPPGRIIYVSPGLTLYVLK